VGTVVVIILVVVILGGIGGTVVYQAAQQPNIHVTAINIPQGTTNPQSSTVADNGRVANSGTFDYTTTLPGTYAITFDNSFSTFSSKSVSVSYTAAGASGSKSFVVGAGNVETVSFTLSTGDRLYGSFSVSGGSGNDINFYITAQTCTQTVNFSFTLVNSGSANGYATVEFQSDGTVLWTNHYYVAQGQQLPERGNVGLSDCSGHNYNILISQTQKS
jgi:hypothetical protein